VNVGRDIAPESLILALVIMLYAKILTNALKGLTHVMNQQNALMMTVVFIANAI